jgi:hypothetical protein
MSRLLFSLPVGLIFVLWAALGMGCGTPSLAVVPVTGKVTVGNQPVTSGQVSLIPEDTKNHPDLCAGTIDASGEYKIFTGGKEGAPLGPTNLNRAISFCQSLPIPKAKFTERRRVPSSRNGTR